MTMPLVTTAVRRLQPSLWGVGDQLLSSATNMGFLIVGARELPIEVFGVAALYVAVYQFFANVVQGALGETHIVREDRSGGADAPATLCVALGVLASVLLVGASLFGVGGPALIALAVCLPGLLAQEFLRYVRFADLDTRGAFTSDAIWAVLQGLAFGWLLLVGEPTLGSLLLAWAAPASVAALYSMRRGATSVTAIGQIGPWWREHRTAVRPFAIETGLLAAGAHLSIFLVAYLSSLDAVAAFRGAMLLFTPVQLAFTGMRMLGLSYLARKQDTATMHRQVVTIGALGAAGVAANTAVVLLLPTGWGTAVLGDTYQLIGGLVLLIAAQRAMLALGVATFCGLRAVGDTWGTVNIRIVSSVVRLLALAIGAATAGAPGAAVGLLASEALSTVLQSLRLRRKLRPQAFAQALPQRVNA